MRGPRLGVLWQAKLFGLSLKVERGPTELEAAFRRGWQRGVFIVLDHVQWKMREIRDAAVAATLAQGEELDAHREDPAYKPIARPALEAKYEMHLDELRAMVETVLRSPEPGR